MRTDELGFWMGQLSGLQKDCHKTEFIEWLDGYFHFAPYYEFQSAMTLDQACDLFLHTPFSKEEWVRRFQRIHKTFPTRESIGFGIMPDHTLLMKFIQEGPHGNKNSLVLPSEKIDAITDETHPSASLSFLFEVHPGFESIVTRSWNSTYEDGIRFVLHFANRARMLSKPEKEIELKALVATLTRVLIRSRGKTWNRHSVEPSAAQELKLFVQALLEKLTPPTSTFAELGSKELKSFKKLLKSF